MRKRKKKNFGRKSRKILISRGGIQLVLACALVSATMLSCVLKHKILPTTIDVNSIEYVTDSLDTFEVWQELSN